MIDNKIKVRVASIAVGHVMLHAQLVMMEFKIKAKLTLTAEDHVLLAVRKNIIRFGRRIYDLKPFTNMKISFD